MSAHRGRQKSLEKKKKRRVAARTAATRSGSSSRSELLHLAANSPFGPAFMSGAWRSPDEESPDLVSVILTRALPNGTFVAQSSLVDRMCLGVKDAFCTEPMSGAELEDFVARYEAAHPEGVEEVSVLEAQSVLFHALEFAGLVGFSPHRDFSAELVGPRPATIIDTPLAYPSRPRYVAGPHDDVTRVTRVLERYWGERAVIDEEAGTEALLKQAVDLWLPHFRGRFPDVVEEAYDEYTRGVLGRALDVERDSEAMRAHVTSLPGLWACFFRPMADGRTGADLARAFGPLRGKAIGEVVERLARARVLFGDVVALDRKANVATVRDAFDGALLRVCIDPTMARGLTRWTRLFGLVIALEDGTCYPPSTLSGHVWLRNVAPRDFVARVNTMLEELGHDEVIDEAKAQVGLARWVGVAHGVLHRMIAPTPAQAAERAKKPYVVNSDGERFEAHEATIVLDADAEQTIAAALAASDDFLRNEGGFEMVGIPRATSVLDAESLASVQAVKPGTWRVMANSTARYERVLARLCAVGRRDVEVSALEVVRPWEVQPGVASEESPDTTRVVMATARIEAPTTRAAKAAARGLMLGAPLRAIDEDVPAVGGKPREVVTTSDGRARVESWLQDWELQGLPPAEGWAFVDLDPVRRELGLPTVAKATKRA